MRSDKKEKIKMLMQLEKLANIEEPTDEQVDEINKLRIILGIFSEKQIYGKKFVLGDYLRLLETMPKATDRQRAEAMGITRNQLSRGKKRNNLVKTGEYK